MSFAPVKINAQKLNSRHSEVDFQRFIGLRRSPGHPVVIINSVELNILIGGRKMKSIIACILVLISGAVLRADEKSAAGVYQSEVGLYVLTVTLLTNGNYLARWDGDIGPNGTASGSWILADGEVRLTPKKEEGHPMTGYLRVLLVRRFEGRQALLRQEDAANEKNPIFYLYLQKKADPVGTDNSGAAPRRV